MKFLYIFIILVCKFLVIKSHISSSIPSSLLKCYQASYTENFFFPPLTMQTLIELIRRLEFDEGKTLNIGVLSNTLLHSLRLDGIRRSESSMESDFIIPYRASGPQFYKYKLLVKYLIENEPFLVPLDTLNISEKCLLHQMISSTTDERLRRDESTSCQVTTSSSESTVSSCPIEKGVVYTKWGTVSPGTIIAAIASSLGSSNIAFQQILNVMNVHKNKTTSSMTYSDVARNRNINNVWTSTLVGDLGEVVLLQAMEDPILDIKGVWNDSFLPRIFYLDESNYDFTRAELLGGIDGLILASGVRSWTSILSRTRLSQLFDMFYSSRGIAYNNTYKSCERMKIIKDILNSDFLNEQTNGVAKLLQEIGLSKQLIFEDTIDSYTPIVVNKFLQNYEKALEEYEYCESNREFSSSLEVITIFDETWNDYDLRRLIALLVQELDISYYGNQLGIIYTKNNSKIVDLFHSSVNVFEALDNLDLSPRSSLSLHESLQAFTNFLQTRTYSDCQLFARKPEGIVFLVFAPTSFLTDSDFRRSLLSLRTIKLSHPEVKMVYVTSNLNSASFATLANSYSGDVALQITTNNIESIVKIVSEQLSDVPGHIIDFYCNKSQVAMEDYIIPNKKTVYEIRHEYIKRANFFVKFKGNGYGDFSVCASDSNGYDKTCKKVEDNKEVNFTVNNFCKTSNCHVKFSINEMESKMKCAELDCRYPDQIRINIFTSWSSCSKIFYTPGYLLLNILLILYIK